MLTIKILQRMKENMPLLKKWVLWGSLWLSCCLSLQTYAQDFAGITVRLGTSSASGNVLNGPVCEGQTIHLRVDDFNPSNTCPFANREITWKLNGSVVSAANNASRYHNISNFSASDEGYYTVEVDCGKDGTIDFEGSFNILMQDNPNAQITIVKNLCSPGAENGASTILEGTACTDCTYDWEIARASGSNTFTSTQNSPQSTFTYSSINSAVSGSFPNNEELVDVDLTITDAVGCQWDAPTTQLKLVPDIMSSFVLPASTPQSLSPLDLALFATVISGLPNTSLGYAPPGYYATSTGAGVTSGLDFYPVSGGTANIDLFGNYEGCLYKISDDILVSDFSVTFSNATEPLADPTWEACVGDDIRLEVSSLGFTPDRIRYPKRDGSQGTLSGSDITISSSGSPRILEFAIPVDAVSGQWVISDGGSNNQVINENILVHNPEIGIVLTKNPVCYDDLIPIEAIPEGGTLQVRQNGTLRSDMLNGNILVASQLDLTNPGSNLGTYPIEIRYRYKPNYTFEKNGSLAQCGTNLIHNLNTEVRDNRLVGATAFPVEFDPDTAVDLRTYIRDYAPTINTSGIDTSFSGTFVQGDSFLVGAAGIGLHPITISIDNGGCIGTQEIIFQVSDSSNIQGLPPAICVLTPQIDFERDPNLPYTPNQVDEVYGTVGIFGTTVLESRTTTTYNQVVSVQVFSESTYNTASPIDIPGGITMQDLNGPNELFYLNVGTIRAHASNTNDAFYVRITYRTTENRQNYTSSWSLFSGWTTQLSSTSSNSNDRLVVQRIVLEQPVVPVIDNGNFPAVFCSDQQFYNFTTFPVFNPNVSSLVLSGGTNGYATGGRQLTATQIDLNALAAGETSSEIYTLSYIYDGLVGCSDTATVTFIIPARIQPFFAGDSSTSASPNTYCLGSSHDFLTPFPLPLFAGESGVFSGPGMGLNNEGDNIAYNSFSPTQADVGDHVITYTFTDQYGCSFDTSEVFRVRENPSVQLFADQSSYCASDTAAYLTAVTPSGGAGIFYGPTIVGDNVYHPNQAYLLDSTAASGGVRVWYEYTDVNGCVNADTIQIYTWPNPILEISGLDPQYCANDLAVGLVGTDIIPNMGGSGSFYGDGIITGTNFYSPSQAGAGPDTVYFAFTNMEGCSDTAFRAVQVDTIPLPEFANLAADYCVNNPGFPLQGQPAHNGLEGQGSFSGPGVVNFGGNYLWTPEDAGTGDKILTYDFTDNNGCSNMIADTIVVHALPITSFVVAPQYCVNSENDTLRATSNSVGVGVFTGDGIVNVINDTTGVLSPPDAGLPGLKEIYYTFTDTFGCTSITTNNYYLNDLPEVSFSGLDPAYCSSFGQVDLIGFPAGSTGQFSLGTPSTAPNSLSSILGGRGEFFPDVAGSGAHTIVYTYTDANDCTNKDSITTEVFIVSNPSISGLDPQYCETQDTFTLTGTPNGGTFFGPGILPNTNLFMPFRSGSGSYAVEYTYVDTFPLVLNPNDTLFCSTTVAQPVTVNPLPVPSIDEPSNNAAFCESDSIFLLEGSISNPVTLDTAYFAGPLVMDSIEWIMVNPTTQRRVTTHYFDPGAMGAGQHTVTYTAINTFGCTDSVTNTYTIYGVPNPQFSIGSVYCESDPSTVLFGSPAGGIFMLNGDTLFVNEYTPNPDYPQIPLTTPTKEDTLIYVVSNPRCEAQDTQYVEVRQNPEVVFEGVNADGIVVEHACMGQDTIFFVPNILGGVFNSPGVLFGTDFFLPEISGVGEYAVEYFYMDEASGCSDTYTDTFSIFNTPNVSFVGLGGCQDTVMDFIVHNDVLGLDGYFGGSLFDAVTAVQWDMGDGTILAGMVGDTNKIEPLEHNYLQAGTYEVSLFVENQYHCVDSDTIRVAVSPKVTPTIGLPYSENFENTSGGWLEESEFGAQSSELWEWGVATGDRLNTVDSTAYNRVWATHLDGPYAPGESGWVYSPCMDLTALDRPMIKLDVFMDTKRQQDGAVIEYFDRDQLEWLPLGQVNKGINWYNTSIIFGAPGLQLVGPMGWSGEPDQWQSSRYKLDAYNHYTDFRFRIAFGAAPTSAQNQNTEGFAFDNVWVGNRTRNVLLEHFANQQTVDMATINRNIYDLAFSANAVRDINLIQYHINSEGSDQFNEDNPADPNSRKQYYGVPAAGRAIINGDNFSTGGTFSRTLTLDDFEYEMLEDPAFDLQITEAIYNANTVQVELTVEALRAMPEGNYAVQIAVLEDSLVYNSNGTMVHSTLRKMLPNHAGVEFVRHTWTRGENHDLVQTWDVDISNMNLDRLVVVAFIQSNDSRVVFQSETNRDISGFLINDISVLEEETLTEIEQIFDLKLYPNPTHSFFNVEFEAPLQKDYNWKLVDMLGRTVQQGTAQSGAHQLTVHPENVVSGSYFFVIEDEVFFTRKQVVLLR